MTISTYEKNALTQIDIWKNPPTSWLSTAVGYVSKPFDYAGEAIMGTPWVGDVITKVMKGVLELANDAAQWSVDVEAILKEYRGDGHVVHALADISQLDLEKADKTVGWLAAKYKGAAFAEGAATGALGAPGLVADVPMLLIGSLRAVGEYATYYGFDINNQHERLYALKVLGHASSPTDATKAAAMAELTKIALDVAKKRTWPELEKHILVKLMQEIAKSLGIRLTKAKLAQIIPVVGSVAGGGYNAYYMAKVCENAHNLYRERFVLTKQHEVDA